MGVEEDLLVEGSKEKAAHFICLICTEVCGGLEPRDGVGCRFEPPVMAKPCDHNFCRGCISNWYKEKKTCPKCSQNIDSLQSMGTNRFALQMYQNLRINCPLKCDWKGTIPDAAKHIREVCPNARVPCPLCGTGVARSNLENHAETCDRRMVECKHCHIKHEFRLTKAHLAECRDVLVPCCCGGRCPRKMIVKHLLLQEGIASTTGSSDKADLQKVFDNPLVKLSKFKKSLRPKHKEKHLSILKQVMKDNEADRKATGFSLASAFKSRKFG